MQRYILPILWNIKLLIKKIRVSASYYVFSILKNVLPKRDINSFNKHSIKKILIVRNDKLGDLIATTGLIRVLAQNGYDVYVSSERNSLEIIRYNPYVKGMFTYKENSFIDLFKAIKKIRIAKFDLVIDLKFCQGIYLKNIFFCSFIRSPNLMGFNKSNIHSYNISIPYYQEKAHVTSRLPLILQLLELPNDDLHYEIFTSTEIEQKAKHFLDNNISKHKKILIFNPFGGNKSRCLTDPQIQTTIKILEKEFQIILIGTPKKIEKIDLTDNVLFFKSNNILEVVPLIKKADLIFTVDTSIVHIASAFSQKTIALYLYLFQEQRPLTIKEQYSIATNEYKNKLFNKLADAPYIQNNNYDKNPPINHLNWAPNNPNAQQLIFNYNAFSEIPLEKFSEKIILAINKNKSS